MPFKMWYLLGAVHFTLGKKHLCSHEVAKPFCIRDPRKSNDKKTVVHLTNNSNEVSNKQQQLSQNIAFIKKYTA